MLSDAQTNARFEAHIAPVRDALTRLLTVSDELRDTRGWLPDANSQAMAELAEEARYAGDKPWSDKPVESAHTLAQWLLYAASDCASGAVRLLSFDETPVYAHMVLARGALEQAGRAWTLIDLAIPVHLRVARAVNERLYGLAEAGRLPITEDQAQRGRERRTALLDIGDQLGFRKVRPHRKTPATLEEERMRQTAVVRALFQHGDDPRLGRLLYGYYSAVAHGTAFALSQSIKAGVPDMPEVPGLTRGMIFTSSGAVASVLTSMILGVGAAFRARNEYLGWKSDEWDSAYLDGLRAAKRAIPSDSK
jgi:hypothetical protein